MSSIIKDLPELINHRVINEETAKDIERYYAAKKEEQGNNTLMIFGSIGAILVGLGLILIFAHNWDNFSKTIKTILAIAPLIICQLAVGYIILQDKSQLFKDISGILLFFTVGSSIALVAQIYSIPGSLDGYLLSWTLLCVTLMYVLKSNILAFLHLGFSTYYAVVAGYFEPDRPWMYLLFLTAFLPFYLRRLKEHPFGRITSLFNFLFPLSLIITLGSFLSGVGEFGLLIYMALLGFIYNTGLLPKLQSRNDYLAMGSAGIAFILILSSFRWMWEEVSSQTTTDVYYIVFWSVLFGGMLYMLIIKGGRDFYKNPFPMTALLFPVVYFIGQFDGLLGAILDNIMVLALGVLTIKKGIDMLDFRKLNFGLLIIATLIICRFFDTNITFAVRGILFVTVGVAFFVANVMLAKKRKIKTLKINENEK